MLTATAPRAPIPTLFLDPTSCAPRLARSFLAERFQEWGIADDYVGRLVVCELVTNAWLHGDGQIIVRLLWDERDGLVMIEVWDQGPDLPTIQPADHAAVSGRGLLLISQLVRDWGTRPITEGGKIVWATCAL